MIEQAFRIGTFANIPVRIHWTFVFIILYIIGSGVVEKSSGMEILIQICFTLSMFLCVVLHEYGHALTARRFGVLTEDIILLPIGGVARLQNFPDKPRHELIIALMGPAVNLFIAVFLFIILFASHGEQMLDLFQLEHFLSMGWSAFIPLLLISNILLMVFNLIPAFPMDGGRVLRALLSMKTNRLTATKWASKIGQVICIIFIGIGIYLGAWTTILIGVFIFFSASQEYSQVAKEFALKNKKIGQFIRQIGTCIPDYLQALQAKQLVLLSGYKNFPVIDLTGQYVGTVSASQILKSSLKNLTQPIKEFMHQQVIVLSKDEDLIEGMRYLESGVPLLLIIEQNEVIGLVDQESIRFGLEMGL